MLRAVAGQVSHFAENHLVRLVRGIKRAVDDKASRNELGAVVFTAHTDIYFAVCLDAPAMEGVNLVVAEINGTPAVQAEERDGVDGRLVFGAAREAFQNPRLGRKRLE